jgi:hypothetical protein
MWIDDDVGLARSMVAGMLIAVAVGSAAGLSGLRGALTRRVVAAVAVGGFGMLLWPPAAALLDLAAPGAGAIIPFAAMLLAAATLGSILRRGAPGGSGSRPLG